jgi:hypothetical protein
VKLWRERSTGASKTGVATTAAPRTVRHARRTRTLVAAGAVVLAAAPPASAVFKPLLTATSAGATVTVRYSQAAAGESAATLAFFAPTTYGTTLPTKVGAVVGTATGNAVAADVRNSTMPLEGTIRVASPTAPLAAGSATTLGAAARACAGSNSLAATWSLVLRGFNQSIPLAIGVQRLSSGPMAGSTAVFVCPPPADVPTGTAGRSPLGLKLVRLTLELPGIFAVPAGTHVWHLKATPYSPGATSANAAGAAEAEAEHGLPQRLTLAATAAGSNRSSVSGRLTLRGEGLAGRTVRILAGGRQVGTATTNAAGAFATTVAVEQLHAMLSARVVVPARYLPACEQPAFAPLPCTTSIVSGFAASARARVS